MNLAMMGGDPYGPGGALQPRNTNVAVGSVPYNPYSAAVSDASAQLGSTVAAAQTQTQQAQQAQADGTQAMNQYGAATGYPSYPNQAGLGTQVPFAPQPPTSPTTTSGDPGATSRGFNPWSLTGEANAR